MTPLFLMLRSVLPVCVTYAYRAELSVLLRSVLPKEAIERMRAEVDWKNTSAGIQETEALKISAYTHTHADKQSDMNR